MLSIDWVSFEETRCKLLISTAGFRRINRCFKKKYKLGRLTPLELKNRFMRDSFTDIEFARDFKSISAFLNLHTQLAEDLLSGWILEKGYRFITLPVYTSPTDEPFPDGFYIKVNAYTSRETVMEAYKDIQFMWEEMERTKDSGPHIRIKKRSQSPDLISKLPIFNLIEQTIYEKLEDQDAGINKNDTEAYKSIVDDSIKFATETVWGRIDLKKGKEIYYTILEYYHLPKFTEFEELLLKLS